MRGSKGMGLSLLDDGCEGLVQLSNTRFGLGGIACLEGLLEGSAQGLLQSLGVGPAVDRMRRLCPIDLAATVNF